MTPQYKFTYLLVMMAFGMLSCSRSQNNHTAHGNKEVVYQAALISDKGKTAGGAYFSRNSNGNPLLCWTETTEKEEEFVVKYANFNAEKNSFDEPVVIAPTKGTRLHSENMNKVAVKEDGTVVAVFAIKHPTAENRFAGSILYTLSKDQGRTWSAATYLHSDTLPVYGRGYFDLELLPDGEIGAVWLDGRFGDASPGSALFFAKTEPGKGFGKDQQIGESTCECCRTDLFVDNTGAIHVAYRDILFPSALMGQQVRDMVHIVSRDGGNTFSSPKRISEDNWAIEGCPHTGPSLAANQDGLHAVWFTAGGDQGLFYANSKDMSSNFGPRIKISATARHPQMATLSSGNLAMVWDEEATAETTKKAVASTQMQQHGNHSVSTGSTKVVLQLRNNGGVLKTISLSDPHASASNPVVVPFNEHAIVAWTQEDQKRSGVYYKMVEVQ